MQFRLSRPLSAGILLIGASFVFAITVACSSVAPEPESEQQLTQSLSGAPSQQAPATPVLEVTPQSDASDASPMPAPMNEPAPQSTTVVAPIATPIAATATVQSATATSAPLSASEVNEGGVMPDADFERALNAARLNTRGWDTDFRFHTVPYSEIRFVIPRDNIPSIDSPEFIGTSEASAWLKDVEPVVALEIDGDARAYPLQILTWHEIVNDSVGGVPVAVTFCPLCNSAISFDRRLDGEVLEFGVSGNLRNSDLIMYDRQTHSWWQQFTGEGIVGQHAGRDLEHLSASIVSFADFKEAQPDGKVLSRDTGFARQYGRNPYAGYDTADGNPFLFTGDLDGRLLPVERVIAVTVDEVDVAFPLGVLQEEGVINYEIGDRQIAVFHKFGTTSALDATVIADSRDVGSAGVFDAVLDGQLLTFSIQDEGIVDDQTGSSWNILGTAIDGPLTSESLSPVVHGNHFWFAWAVFKPDTILYEGRNGA